MLEVALAYLRRGWTPVPIVYRGKRPIGEGWQLRRITEDTAHEYFNGAGYNIGLQLGAASGGLTDVDLDCREAIAIAPYVLPATKAIFGRQSKRASHRLYISELWHETEAAAFQFRDPRSKDILVELRIGGGDKGAQTVAPPSVHESGEEVRWEEDGAPAAVEGDELVYRVRLVGALALMARYWPAKDSHARHQAALVCGGFLARCGLQRAVLREYVGAAAKTASDEEWRDRRQAAQDAAIAHGAGKHSFGFIGLAEMFGRDIAERIAEWLAYDGDSDQRQPNGAAGEPQPQPVKRSRVLRVISIDDWETRTMRDRDWAVVDRIPLRQTTLFTGEGATGKSILALQLCSATTLGRDWLGTLPTRGPALYIEAEDDVDEIHRRLEHIRLHYECRYADMAGLHLISLAGQDAVMALQRGGKIVPTDRYHELYEIVCEIRPKVIIMASVANFFAGNENDRAQVQQFIGLTTNLAIAANGAVVLVGHPSLSGMANDSGISGSTAWHNSVRARIYIKAVNETETLDQTDLREITFKKSNYGPTTAKIVLGWRNGLFLPVHALSGPEKAAHQSCDEELFLSCLDQFTRQGRRVSPRKGPNYAPAAFAESALGKRIGRTRLKAAMDRLFEAKKIVSVLNPDLRYGRGGMVIVCAELA